MAIRISGLALLIAVVLLGWLVWLESGKDGEIFELEQEALARQQIFNDDLDRLRFELKQHKEVELVNDETELDEMEDERGDDGDYEDKNRSSGWGPVER